MKLTELLENPGPYGNNGEFFKSSRDIIPLDVVNQIQSFFREEIDL